MDQYEELVSKGQYIERDAYSLLLDWKNSSARDHIGLFLKGSRRVGKTILALSLAHREYKSFVLISFLNANEETKDLFINGLDDLDRFYDIIQIKKNVKLYEGESLIILDEVQLFPQARVALKTLLEDGRYDFIETGSLAGIERNSKGSFNPSEEDEVEVLPLSFIEYLKAKKEDDVIPFLKKSFEKQTPVGASYQKIMRLFREYMLIGGMPQSVSAYLKDGSFAKSDKAKRRINALYLHDEIGKNEEKEDYPIYVNSFYENIPNELNKHDKIYRLSHIDKNARYREYASAIRWLGLAYCANLVFNATDPSPAFPMSAEGDTFKCYLMDTGLLFSLCSRGENTSINDYYKKALYDSLHLNEGMLIENLVAQCLRTNGYRLFFYERADKNYHTEMEIDFLIQKDFKVIPIEVKSAGSSSIKSLLKFKEKFGKKIGEPIVLHDGEVKKENGILYLPYFFAPFI